MTHSAPLSQQPHPCTSQGTAVAASSAPGDAAGEGHRIEAAGQVFDVRRAQPRDVAAIVELLRDDPLGRSRKSVSLTPYHRVFARIDADPQQFLAVCEDRQGDVVGTMQLTLIPGLSRGGSTRLLIEAVRVRASHRGHGLGAAMFRWAHAYGRAEGADLAQLTTDLSREGAHRFYEQLGYTHSHAGMKLPLTRETPCGLNSKGFPE